MTVTNKWLLISESHGDSNRCTVYRGKPDQHITRFSRSVSVWSITICISHGPHIATLRTSSTALAESLLPRKRAPNIIHSTSADRSTGPYPVSLPSQPMKQWRKSNIYQQQATRLIGHISTSMRSIRSILARGGQAIGP
jgi:hypothetical protein